MPESISSCGLLIAPPQSSTSRVARTVCSAPAWRKVTPGGPLPLELDPGGERAGRDGEVGAGPGRA